MAEAFDAATDYDQSVEGKRTSNLSVHRGGSDCLLRR